MLLCLPLPFCASLREVGTDFFVRPATSFGNRLASFVDLLLQPRNVFAILLHVIAHQFAHDLRCRPISRLGSLHERIPQFGLELHREDGFLGHGTPPAQDTDKVYTSSVSRKTGPYSGWV